MNECECVNECESVWMNVGMGEWMWEYVNECERGSILFTCWMLV